MHLMTRTKCAEDVGVAGGALEHNHVGRGVRNR